MVTQLAQKIISIHAPTRGATIAFEFWTRAFYISIHAPTRGATCITRITFFLLFHFNPRSYKRSDNVINSLSLIIGNFNPRSYKRSDSTESFKVSLTSISIHAPTRGAT